MQPHEIIEAIDTTSLVYPHAAIAAALQQPQAVTPALLELLERRTREVAEADMEDRQGHEYAMLLLAVFRETRAYPLVARLAALPPDDLDILIGDGVTENLGAVLASVCGGDTSLIEQIIENQEADEFARGAALEALMILFVAGVMSREVLVRYFRELFEGKLEREPSQVWDELCVCATSLYPDVLLPHIERSYEEGLIDPFSMRLYEVHQVAEQDRADVLSRLPHTQAVFVQDVAEECAWWAAFGGRPRPQRHKRLRVERLFFEAVFPLAGFGPGPLVEDELPLKSTPELRRAFSTLKINPNQPCPCESGKKYKKCCGRQDVV